MGVTPWVPLEQFKRPPEALLQQCREHVERLAPPHSQADLLAVAQIMAGLRFPQPELLTLLGVQRIMKESPVLRDYLAESLQTALVGSLQTRFGEVPQTILRRIRLLKKEAKLHRLIALVTICNSLQDFQEHFAD